MPISGIREVVFYLGRPADGQRPAGAVVVPGRPVDANQTRWAASFPLRDAKLGPTEITAEFVAGVGLSQSATASVEVVEAIPVEPGGIRGTVREGERPQVGFEVVARDEKNAERGKAKTDDRGRFTIGGLPPGSYQGRQRQGDVSDAGDGERRGRSRQDHRGRGPNVPRPLTRPGGPEGSGPVSRDGPRWWCRP